MSTSRSIEISLVAVVGENPRVGPNKPARGFTLIEMLVVIGIMALLLALLLPVLNKASAQAKRVECMSNLRQIGMDLLIYSENSGGYLFPDHMGWSGDEMAAIPGTNPPQYDVWTYVVFKVWNPPIMLCPADLDPAAQHSYVINEHLAYWRIKYSTALPNHVSPSDVILMGEKYSTQPDYYMEYGDFDRLVNPYRHGLSQGSNYLMLDMHVGTLPPVAAAEAMDPWDFAGGLLPPTAP
jgi:prepilin-type N-terminal cleavage/methylation domain-containing protein